MMNRAAILGGLLNIITSDLCHFHCMQSAEIVFAENTNIDNGSEFITNML